MARPSCYSNLASSRLHSSISYYMSLIKPNLAHMVARQRHSIDLILLLDRCSYGHEDSHRGLATGINYDTMRYRYRHAGRGIRHLTKDASDHILL